MHDKNTQKKKKHWGAEMFDQDVSSAKEECSHKNKKKKKQVLPIPVINMPARL